jgi:hypothetical protein
MPVADGGSFIEPMEHYSQTTDDGLHAIYLLDRASMVRTRPARITLEAAHVAKSVLGVLSRGLPGVAFVHKTCSDHKLRR